jgi:DNA-binding NarL/FixJ family response regulator
MGHQLLSPQLNPRSPDPAGPAPSGSPVRPALTRIVLMGGSAEDRLLLRGLLRLHRHRVAAEIPAADDLHEMVASDERKVLIFLIGAGGSDWWGDLSDALAKDPRLTAIVLTSSRSPEFDRRAAEAGARAVLQRPFTVKDLIATVEAVARDENPLAGPGPG